MSPLRADVEQAARRAATCSSSPQDWNPVYRGLWPGAGRHPYGPHDPEDRREVDRLLHRQFSARALLVVATTEGTSTRRVRLGLHPGGATAESSRDEEPATWSEMPSRGIPGVLRELLAPAGFADAPPVVTVHREADGLRLTAEQADDVRRRIVAGRSPEAAVAGVEGIDPRLQDAWTAPGPRASASLTLHDPTRQVVADPVTWSRLWVRGARGLYRIESGQTPLGAVHPVQDGDVLGTLVPILEEGRRFATACARRADAR